MASIKLNILIWFKETCWEDRCTSEQSKMVNGMRTDRNVPSAKHFINHFDSGSGGRCFPPPPAFSNNVTGLQQ
jgi:hypothetical protein